MAIESFARGLVMMLTLLNPSGSSQPASDGHVGEAFLARCFRATDPFCADSDARCVIQSIPVPLSEQRPCSSSCVERMFALGTSSGGFGKVSAAVALHLVVDNLRLPGAGEWNDVLGHESEDTVVIFRGSASAFHGVLPSNTKSPSQVNIPGNCSNPVLSSCLCLTSCLFCETADMPRGPSSAHGNTVGAEGSPRCRSLAES